MCVRLRGATVARLTPDQKVACSNHVGVKANILETIYCDIALSWVLWLKLPAWKIGDRRLELRSGIKFQRDKMFLPA